MATIHQNLSNYNEQSVPNGASYTIAIVQSEWNEDITKNLAPPRPLGGNFFYPQ